MLKLGQRRLHYFLISVSQGKQFLGLLLVNFAVLVRSITLLAGCPVAADINIVLVLVEDIGQ